MLRKLRWEEKERVFSDINSQYEACLELDGLFLSKDEKREAKRYSCTPANASRMYLLNGWGYISAP